MPKLQALLACEKIIFDRDGPVSLISIFQRMNIPGTGVPLPEKAISPTVWNVFVLWESDPSEIGQEFVQVLRVIAPDGSIFAENEGLFKNSFAGDSQIKTKTQILGLPIWQEGWITVRASLKGDEFSTREFKFEIRYLPPPPPPTVET